MKKIFILLFVSVSAVLSAQGHFSGKVQKSDIKEVCDAVTSWQIENFGDVRHGNLNWTNGPLYIGMFEWAGLTEDEGVFSFLRDIGKKNGWRMPSRVYHADDICVGQAFIKMYLKYGDPKMLQPTLERAFYVASHPSDAPLSKSDEVGKNTRWSWCDALFMAPPVYAALYRITGEQVFADYLESEFRECTDSLYDKEEHLYYRDCMRIGQPESNGEKQFWARGDGWVFAGIPQILEYLPEDYPARGYYEQIFKEMAERIIELQDKDGHWHASLLNPKAYPEPENSASGFFVYGLGWGIRHGLLDMAVYGKHLEKGWKALVRCVSDEGKLGYVQPVGASPQKSKAEATEVYGVGAFLLAGSELYRYASK